jgi:hypothetical protein
MIRTLAKNYDENVVKVSYTGGVFKSGDLILKTLRENLKGCNIELVEPQLDSRFGCMFACIY